jgi:hypothetical protein
LKNRSINAAGLLRNEFERFAENECKGASPIYYELSKQIASDDELLHLCAFVKDGQPVPNAFLAAIHFFILKNKNAALANYYPSVTGQKTPAIPFGLFKAFVLQHQQEIVYLLQHRIVQTNVLTRCNYLLPIFSNILSEANGPATLIDIGSSAGLNLNFDRYEYYYDNKKVYGDSPVKLHCQIKAGKAPTTMFFNYPLQKIGIDQHPIDLANADDLTWLQALIWPDQTERFIQLKEALYASNLSDIKMIAGSTVADFKKVIESIDPNAVLILSATHVLYQFTDYLLLEFYSFLDALGQSRDFYFLSAEATEAVQLKYSVANTAVVLTTYKNNQKQEMLIAETNGHGNWIKWT